MSEKKHKLARKQMRKEEGKELEKEPPIKEELKVGNYKPKKHDIFEAIFSILYLLFLVIAIVLFIVNYKEGIELLFISMTFILLFGDSCHLIPRIIKNFRGYTDNTVYWLGLGNQISSITMTGFYFILYVLWKGLISPDSEVYQIIELIIYGLLSFRFLICFIKENNWYSQEGNFSMSLVRNIPFCIAGCIIAVLYITTYGILSWNLWKVGIAVILSFAFYMPVVIGVRKHPKLGVLMIPKTICYISIIVMFLIMMFG